MGISLDWFQLDPAWSRLLEALPTWRRAGSGSWTDGWTVVELSSVSGGRPRFGFSARGPGASLPPTILPRGGERRAREADVMTPASIPVRFRAPECDPCDATGPFTLRMNHVSVNVGDVARERRWYEQVLGPSTVLARDAAWEPVSRRFVRDAHLFRSPWYYLTIRESQGPPGVDHVGWMADEPGAIDRLAEVVAGLGWKVVYGPAEVDGSYLVHFEGPDGNVHDFFCPLAELKEQGS